MIKARVGKKGDAAGEHSPYCAFKSDRERLLALVSRDIRLVLIALLVALAAPALPGYLHQVWAVTRAR